MANTDDEAQTKGKKEYKDCFCVSDMLVLLDMIV